MRRMLLIAGLVVAIFASPAYAQYPGPGDFTVSTPSPLPGQTVTVTGRCYVGSTVTIKLDGTTVVGTGVVAAPKSKATVDKPTNTVDIPVTIPPGTTPGAHTLVVYCDGQQIQVLDINVQRPGGSTTTGVTPTTASGNLARTGTDVAPMVSVGAILLAAGAMLVLVSRKRRAQQSTP